MKLQYFNTSILQYFNTSILLIITLYSLLFNFSSTADQKEKARQNYKQATEELPGAIKELTDIIRKENQARRGLSANNLVELNNMRATVALKRKPDGSFCQLDVRGNSKLTPSFVKSAHRKASAPKSDTPVCSKSDIKVFQKGAKKLNLKGGKAQKSSLAAAILGSTAKAAGLGCVFGAGISWVANMFSDNEKTEAGSSCIDCANQKSKEEKEVKDLKSKVAGVSGGLAGATVLGTHKNPMTNPLLLDVAPFKNEITLTDVKRQLQFEEIIKKLHKEGIDMDNAVNKVKEIDASVKEQMDLRKSRHFKDFITNKDQLAGWEENFNNLKRRQKFWHRIVRLHEKNYNSSQIDAVLRGETFRRLKNIPENKLASNIPDKVVQARIEKIQDKADIKRRFKTPIGVHQLFTGIVGGVAGAIVCEDGTTYLLSKEKIEDI